MVCSLSLHSAVTLLGCLGAVLQSPLTFMILKLLEVTSQFDLVGVSHGESGILCLPWGSALVLVPVSHASLICPSTDDSHWILWLKCICRTSPVHLPFPLCNYIVFCKEVLLNSVNMPIPFQTLNLFTMSTWFCCFLCFQ